MKRALLVMAWLGMVAGLLALGTWQIERRAWKRDLIAQVEARLRAPPVPAPVMRGQVTVGQGDAYRRVVVAGRFLADSDSFVQASTVRGPGWWVLTPLRTDDDRIVLVNRGYVPRRYAAPVSTQRVTVTGLLRLTEPGGGFLRRNDPVADRWYSRDVAAIAARLGVAAAPYFIDAGASAATPPAISAPTPAAAPGQPVGGLTVVAFPNNHLVYAITWYILAMMNVAGLLYWLSLPRRREGA